MKCSRIAIIGAGSVGATTAYAILLKNIAAEIMLIDLDETRCKGEVFDLEDAVPFYRSSRIVQGTLAQASSADIIVITAGSRQKPGQSRAELVQTNYKVVTAIAQGLKPINQQAIVIVVTNPVDVLTQCIQELIDVPRNQIIGSGTLLDTQRLRTIIKRNVGVAEQSIHVSILGEHGDSQFAAWSCAHIAGVPILDFSGLSQSTLDEYAQQAKQKAYDIIAFKQATYFGVAACVASMCEAILFDQKRVVPLSTYVPEYNVCLSVPVVLGALGVERVIAYSLSQREQGQLEASVQAIKNTRNMCN